MSYIQVFTKPENEVELPEGGHDIVAELDSEPIAFCARLLHLVDDLGEDTVIIIRKVIF